MKTEYTVKDGTSLVAKRSFAAPLDKVWHAWTDSEMLDKWWGPLPYNAVTESFSFTEGGEWRYKMVEPEGDEHYCLNTYRTIDPMKRFTAEDSFCNQDWTTNKEMPSSHWTVEFAHEEGVTHLCVTTSYASEEELRKVTEMGMKEGFDMGLNQLESLLG